MFTGIWMSVSAWLHFPAAAGGAGFSSNRSCDRSAWAAASGHAGVGIPVKMKFASLLALALVCCLLAFLLKTGHLLFECLRGFHPFSCVFLVPDRRISHRPCAGFRQGGKTWRSLHVRLCRSVRAERVFPGEVPRAFVAGARLGPGGESYRQVCP